MTSTVEYLGKLRTKNTHLQSGTVYITDAPTDNHGKGEAFSPTDTVATAVGNCILTTLGIKLKSEEKSIVGATAKITKTMAATPRRISQIDVQLYFPQKYDDKTVQWMAQTSGLEIKTSFMDSRRYFKNYVFGKR